MGPSNSTVWISHRGYCEEAPENTRSSFDAAVAQGFCALETDLRMTSDGHIVLSHDVSLARIGGPATPVSEMTRRELAAVLLPNGERPLFFEEFIERYAGYSWTFDIKAESGFAVIAALSDWMAKKRAQDWLLSNGQFLFWDVKQRQTFLRLFPSARIYASEAECWRAGLAIILGSPWGSGIRNGWTYSIKSRVLGVDLFSKRVVDYYHLRRARILAYLPESAALAEQAERCGFDEILTNGRFRASAS